MQKKNTRAFALAASALGMLMATSCTHVTYTCDCPSSRYEGGKFYAQFYEDYILSVVFKDVATGLYVDVGANDPDHNSVTRYFYERGWRGVNIEPNQDRFREIVKARPRDSNYNVGIANTEGTMTFYQAPRDEDGLSSFDKADVDRLTRERHITFTEIPVQVTPLSKVLATAALAKIDFMSIDVEGFEKQVLESLDLPRYKPDVLCIEATQPFTEISSHREWEEILLKNNYLFAMFDGINRYYVHKDRADLLPRFIEADRCVKLSKFKRKVNINGMGEWR
jgi:FkbM family methyltransferase